MKKITVRIFPGKSSCKHTLGKELLMITENGVWARRFQACMQIWGGGCGEDGCGAVMPPLPSLPSAERKQRAFACHLPYLSQVLKTQD